MIYILKYEIYEKILPIIGGEGDLLQNCLFLRVLCSCWCNTGTLLLLYTTGMRYLLLYTTGVRYFLLV